MPLLHVLIARVVAGRRGDLLLAANAPWSLWMIASSIAVGTFGYAAYGWMLVLALLPITLTLRIVYVFCRDVMNDAPRAAVKRTLAHQAITWLVAALYLDRSVSLWPRIIGWLS